MSTMLCVLRVCVGVCVLHTLIVSGWKLLLLLFVLLKLNKKKKYLLHRQSKATLTKLTTRAGEEQQEW